MSLHARPARGRALARALALSLPLSAAAPPVPLGAQPAARPLGKAEVEHGEPFTAISGLRELRDGRVIVSDSRDKTLQLIDLGRGTATPVGRAGAGPGEWSLPTRLYALPGDSTLMIDGGNGRLFLVTPDGKPAPTVPLTERHPLSGAELVGVDDAGRMLLVASRRPPRPMDGSVGAADVMRYDRRSGRVDTIATLTEPKGERSAAQMLEGGMMRMVTNLPFASRDLAVIAPDGRVAIVRASPYAVEWIAPDGRRAQGPVAAAPAVRITAAEKEAFTRSQIRPGAILVREGPAPPPAGSAKRAASVPKLSSAQIEAMMNPDQAWPAVKPPFLERGVHMAPDGRVWVLRTRAHDDPVPTFDVFDAAGRVVERVALPARTRLVGFGKATVYLARTDDDDLVWLQRVRR